MNSAGRRRYLARAWRAQRGLCGLCAAKMPRVGRGTERTRPSLDHVVPRGMQGSNSVTNQIAAHNGCNNAKGDRPPTGCELVWLSTVRAVLHDGAQPLPPTRQLRRFARMRAL